VVVAVVLAEGIQEAAEAASVDLAEAISAAAELAEAGRVASLRLGFMRSHPSRKNKNAARMGHP